MLFATDPLFKAVRNRRPLPPVEELVIVGRRTGRERRVRLQLVEVGNGLYVVESSGIASDWAANLAGTGNARVLFWDGRDIAVTAVELGRGAERDAAIGALPNGQPRPLRFLYRRAAQHIDDVGRVFRLERCV